MMNKGIKNIKRSIQEGRELEENIPQLFHSMANHYQVLAKVRLALHYFTFYELYYDEEDTWSRDALELTKSINEFLGDNILQSKSGLEREKAIQEIDSIRQEIMKRMKVLTVYTDIFQNFEYVLNRVEYRFREFADKAEDMEFAKEILRYIFDTEDNMIINEKIKEIIGQLPIRITKQKYYEIIKESMGVYLGANSSSLDTFLYMIKTSAMLHLEEGMESLYPSLWDKKEFLLHLDYKDITKDNYDVAVNLLKDATLVLERQATVYLSLQEIVNELYVILLCNPYSSLLNSNMEAAEKASDSVITAINTIFLAKDHKEISSELLEPFADLEGVQEDMSYDIEILESAFYETAKNHRDITVSLMLDPLLQVLERSQGLLSNSLFIDFTESKEDEVVDEERIAKETEGLLKDLAQLFEGQDRMIVRSIIANTINKVPVFFKDHKDVMDYVTYSLTRCTDQYEKAACVEIITNIMES